MSLTDTTTHPRSLPVRHQDGTVLPPEIAFLAGGLVPASLLARVADEAARLGMSADVVLLAEGHLSANAYYRALATSLDLPFAEHPPRLAHGASLPDALATGVVPLAPQPEGWRYLVAPRGAALGAFLAFLNRHDGALPVALTSPDRLEALVRHDARQAILRTATHGLTDWNSALSAAGGLTARQAGGLVAATVLFAIGATLDPDGGALAVAVFFALAFLAATALRLAATGASTWDEHAAPSRRIADADLPVYSVVVPLFREAKVVTRLVESLDRLDYPKAKLDIMLMVEANDPATLDAIECLRLPGRYRTIVAPAGRPQTKPRALNIALQFARGAFVVIFDAEDEPEPSQLRAAVDRFAARPQAVCLQAQLAIDNIDDSWITRLFALEYAALFHVCNPGLAKLGLPVPLGGTSNHFRIGALRQANGWDAWNVTEDIDLGIRLARLGLVVDSLAATTFEEAPNTLKAWLAQRSRWQKGWMVTLATHSRDPLCLWRDLGPVRTLAVIAMLFGTIASCLLGPFFGVVLALRFWSGDLLHPRTGPAAAWSVASLTLLGLGVMSAVWPMVLGLHRRRLPSLLPWIALLPAYLLLLSIAAWQAAFEVIGRPYAWTKTEHGKAKRRQGAGTPAR